VSERRAVYNEHGFMAFVSQDYAAKGLKRGELQETDDGHLMVVPQPVNKMTPAEARAYHLAKEREARSNR
jgi:hypothetical protein